MSDSYYPTSRFRSIRKEFIEKYPHIDVDKLDLMFDYIKKEAIMEDEDQPMDSNIRPIKLRNIRATRCPIDGRFIANQEYLFHGHVYSTLMEYEIYEYLENLPPYIAEDIEHFENTYYNFVTPEELEKNKDLKEKKRILSIILDFINDPPMTSLEIEEEIKSQASNVNNLLNWPAPKY